VIDFGTLPPEINSGRMYTGPGSEPMMAAASAWQAIASQLDSFARCYAAAIDGLQGDLWSGGACVAMADAAQPYVAWVAAASAQAEETAECARTAGAAYEIAHAATVPPAVVAANRDLYSALVNSNVVGQNTPAIAAADAEYAEMWAQDAHAMYSYAATSAAAISLTRFNEPPQTTSATARPAQATAVSRAVGSSSANSQSVLAQLMAALPQQLQGLATAGSPGSATTGFTSFMNGVIDFDHLTQPGIYGAAVARTFFSGGSYQLASARTAEQAKDLPKIAEEGGGAAAKAETIAPQSVRSPVLAAAGRAAPIGGLSVPQSWASSTPIASAVEEPQWMSDADLAAAPTSADTAFGATAGAGPMLGMSPAPSQWARNSVNNVLRVAPRRYTMPRPALGG
jgi:PPE-repeat protein